MEQASFDFWTAMPRWTGTFFMIALGLIHYDVYVLHFIFNSLGPGSLVYLFSVIAFHNCGFSMLSCILFLWLRNVFLYKLPLQIVALF